MFRDLLKENHLRGLDKDDLCDRLAYYAAEINILHPFREGNGRTQREFLRCLAKNAGYELDLSRVDRDKMLNAFIRSVTDTKDLANLFRESITEREKEIDRGLER